MTIIARVVILSKYADIDKPLDYQIPSGTEIKLGQRVQVPLGKRRVEGVVIDKLTSPPVRELKEVIGTLDLPPIPADLLKMVNWLAITAGSPLGPVLQCMLPPKPVGKKLTRWQLAEAPAPSAPLSPKQRQVVEWLAVHGAALKAEIVRGAEVSSAPIDNLIAKGLLVPAATADSCPDWQLDTVAELTDEQRQALARMRSRTQGWQQPARFLLHGVTGSGKTEIYIRIAREVVAGGQQVLVLVPEIALTGQVVARFRAVFEDDVAVFHSGLDDHSRWQQWRNIADGRVKIVVATRSGVFAPFSALGLVVIDEEHEPAYKQEETPRYHARDVALFRARQHGATVVLGSATPALETYRLAGTGQLELVKLDKRVAKQPHLPVELVDMRRELAQGNRSVFSRSLFQGLKQVVERKEQAILFLNRRGVAPTLLCRSCGFRYQCPNCSTALTLHLRQLRCHHCGHAKPVRQQCPQCGSQYLRELGLGTQKLEQQLRQLFPGIPVMRLDRDSAASATVKEQYLHDFYRQQRGILVGTQMIAKGLDFPNVTLMGIVLADLSLTMPDFRAAERTFQLVTQAAGRAGRAQKPGRVIVQTYQPEHYSLRFALAGDYTGFYNHELQVRRRAGLPPFAALTRILISAPEQAALAEQVAALHNVLLAVDGVELLLSSPPPLERLRGRYRWHFVLRHQGTQGVLADLDQVRQRLARTRGCRVIFDHTPHSFM